MLSRLLSWLVGSTDVIVGSVSTTWLREYWREGQR